MKKKITNYVKELIRILKQREMSVLPANIAYYIVMALIPTLTIIVLIASSFSISIDSLINLLSDILPEQASSVIIDVISGKGFDSNLGFFNIVAFALATNGTYSIVMTANTLYKVNEVDTIKDRIRATLLLILIVILFLFLIVVPIFGDNILSLIKSAKVFKNFINQIILAFKIVKWPFTFLIIYFNIKLIYTIAPSRQIPSSSTTYGALFTTVIWSISTVVFKIYLNNFARYDIVYGNLANIVMLLLWFYILAYIFVIGLCLNKNKTEEGIEQTNTIILDEIRKRVQEEKKKK